MCRPVCLALLIILMSASLFACSEESAGTPNQQPPQTSLGSVALNPHPTSLEGKTVVLRWNGKPNGDKLLTRVAELLTEQAPGVNIIKLWETDPDTAVSSDDAELSVQIAEKVAALTPDLVIASQCD